MKSVATEKTNGKKPGKRLSLEASPDTSPGPRGDAHVGEPGPDRKERARQTLNAALAEAKAAAPAEAAARPELQAAFTEAIEAGAIDPPPGWVEDRIRAAEREALKLTGATPFHCGEDNPRATLGDILLSLFCHTPADDRGDDIIAAALLDLADTAELLETVDPNAIEVMNRVLGRMSIRAHLALALRDRIKQANEEKSSDG